MNKPGILIVLSLFSLGLLVMLLVIGDSETRPSKHLMIYCAAGIKDPIDAVIEKYQAEFGTQVQIQYSGSGTLLNNFQLEKRGDLYIAADTSYIKLAQEKNLIAEVLPVAMQRPIIVTQKGNPKGIQSVEDLLKEGTRVSLANPEAASIGKVTQKLLTKLGLWEKMEAHVVAKGVFKPTVNDVANDVKLGAVDAAIVWDATAKLYPELQEIPIQGAENFVEQVTCAVLNFSAQPKAALHFARYLNAPEKGQLEFSQRGYGVVEGDNWAETPELIYYSGGVNRLAIEDTLTAFGEREGVKINTVYNGCGILLGQIKTGARPDVYHTCDATFMKGVEDLFTPAEPISKTDIVIITKKGNPSGVNTLADLAENDLQVGLCHEEQSSLGALTAGLLKDAGVYDTVHKNVVVTTPTADMLVNQVDVGKLDAAVVYMANTLQVRDKCEVIPIVQENALATQTIAISQDTQYPNLTRRLNDALHSQASLHRFEASGFKNAQASSP